MMKKSAILLLVFSLIGLFSSFVIAEEQERKTLRVTNSKAWKPFSYLAEDGSPRGILIDLWKLYGEQNGVDIEFVLVDWNDSLTAVEEGKADVHAGMLWSEPRELRFDFAEPIMTINTQLYLSQRIITTDLNFFSLETVIEVWVWWKGVMKSTLFKLISLSYRWLGSRITA